jgi:D-alanine-D-alanine ligase
LLFESQESFPFQKDEPWDANSELLENLYVDEVVNGISDLGIPVDPVKTSEFLEQLATMRYRFDYVVNMSKGLRGPAKKSLVPGLLDYLGMPYLGSDPYVLSFVRNKAHLKAFAAHLGLATPRFALISRSSDVIEARLPPFPLFVKPCHESSSIGIDEHSLVNDTAALRDAVNRIVTHYRQPAMVEEFLSGREFSVPIIGNDVPNPLGVVELVTESGDSLEGSYLTSSVVYRYRYGLHVPSGLAAALERRLKDMAVALYSAVGFRDYGRVDFRLDQNGAPNLLEASTHPHLAKHSDFFTLYRSAGRTYSNMLEDILAASWKRVATTYTRVGSGMDRTEVASRDLNGAA